MRVLILSAFLACAAAAPSGIIQPVLYSGPVAVPAAVPTISPGDLQAAAIDAQVKANDLAREAADKAQEATDQAIEVVEGRAITDATLANEKNIEAFWSYEDKKWQALDAIKTAEAQIDGVAASNAEAYAKSSFGAIPTAYITAQPGFRTFTYAQPSPVLPVVAAPISPDVYSNYLAAVKTISTQNLEVKAEENKMEKMEEQSAAVKAAEPAPEAKPELQAAEVKTAEPQAAEVKTAEFQAAQGDSVKIEAASDEKQAEGWNKPLLFANPLATPFVGIYRYDVALPAVSPILAQPVLKYATSYQQVNGALAPTFVKHAW